MLLAGILTPIEDILTSLLEWLHSSVGISWAWAIVVLTVMVRIVLVPLTIKQIRSMQRLQQYAPELKALQQKYKGDKQRLNEEVMKFYKENKVNPAASCLPILLQVPIFFSLFYVLRGFEKEVFPNYQDSSLSFLNGVVPNITDKVNEHWSGYVLLVIYVGSQLASTLLMSTTMDKKQRVLFMIVPFVVIPFVVNFPVGLMIYWVTTNLWTAGQGLVTRRLIPRTAPVAQKRTSRTPAQDEKGSSDGKPATLPKTAPAKRTPTAAAATDAKATPQRQVRRRKKKGPRSHR